LSVGCSARPYAEQLRKVLANLTSHIENISHPLLEIRPEHRILFVIVTADRGLCGAFNSNIIRTAQSFIRDHSGQTLNLAMVGRKGRDFIRSAISLATANATSSEEDRHAVGPMISAGALEAARPRIADLWLPSHLAVHHY